MERYFNSFKWYTPEIRIVNHVVFWLLVTVLYYLNYSRIGGDYIWFFVAKELFVTVSLFYSVTWIISKWVSKGQIFPLLTFIVFAYCWWLWWTYVSCYIARNYIPKFDKRFDLFLSFILGDGFFSLFNPKKFSVLVLDFLFMASIPLAPKLTKVVLDSSMKMVKLERDNLAKELDFLKSQISPHFLFNSLNSIYRMSETNDPQTPGFVLRMSNLVRYILYEAKNEEISLGKEVAFIKDYIDLAKLRYGDKVPICDDIAEINEPYKIVPLMLIPFVENAFKHGPDRSRSNAWVDILLSITDDVLLLSVKNGVNYLAEKPKFGGVGLSNVKRRLELHYPDRHRLEIEEQENSYYVELNIYLK